MHMWWFVSIKIPFYLELWLFGRRSELLPFLVACSESKVPFLAPLPGPQHPPFPPSCSHIWTFTTTDDINMPKSSSVGHNVSIILELLAKLHPCHNPQHSWHDFSHFAIAFNTFYWPVLLLVHPVTVDNSATAVVLPSLTADTDLSAMVGFHHCLTGVTWTHLTQLRMERKKVPPFTHLFQILFSCFKVGTVTSSQFWHVANYSPSSKLYDFPNSYYLLLNIEHTCWSK